MQIFFIFPFTINTHMHTQRRRKKKKSFKLHNQFSLQNVLLQHPHLTLLWVCREGSVLPLVRAMSQVCEVIPLHSLQLQACVLSLLLTEGYLISFLIKSTKFFPNHLHYYMQCAWLYQAIPSHSGRINCLFQMRGNHPRVNYVN